MRVGVYAGVVLLATQVLRIHDSVAVAASTLAAFAARLKDEVNLESVRTDLAGVVRKTLEPTHVSVWVRERG